MSEEQRWDHDRLMQLKGVALLEGHKSMTFWIRHPKHGVRTPVAFWLLANDFITDAKRAVRTLDELPTILLFAGGRVCVTGGTSTGGQRLA